MLPIDEVFGPAIQGEGMGMGNPSIFVRTGGCNFSCANFGCKTISPLDNKTVLTGCDTIHAANAKHFKHTWKYYENFDELVQKIESCFIGYEDKYNEKVDIIFTGGEPLLHHKDEVMLNSIEYFISRGHRVWVETNATVMIDFDKYPIYKKVCFSMSVKMSTSGEPIYKRWKPEVANNYLRNTNGSYFKFVLSKESIEIITNEILEFLKQVPAFGLVYLMPLGETREQLDENAKTVYEYALKNGFRYSDRIHIRIYNDLSGV